MAELNSTVRPAVSTVRTTAWSGEQAGSQLVAVAVDDEQAVVDGQAQTEGGGEVEREDRDVGDALDGGEGGEGAADGDQRRRRGAAQAATRLPNTKTSSTRVMGMAMPSALPRSLVTVSPSWRNTAA